MSYDPPCHMTQKVARCHMTHKVTQAYYAHDPKIAMLGIISFVTLAEKGILDPIN